MSPATAHALFHDRCRRALWQPYQRTPSPPQAPPTRDPRATLPTIEARVLRIIEQCGPQTVTSLRLWTPDVECYSALRRLARKGLLVPHDAPVSGTGGRPAQAFALAPVVPLVAMPPRRKPGRPKGAIMFGHAVAKREN